MDNTMVSARVPRAKKEKVASILASIEATTSDLINSAFDYVIAEKQLPQAYQSEKPKNLADFKAFTKASSLNIDWPENSAADYRELMRRERLADYESLA